tara:strand:- start:225 stop:1010 length:786 start_codon:yes stop_codon:yes gene_type:complete
MAPLGISSGLMYVNYNEGGPAIQESEYSIEFDGTGYLDTGDTYQSTFRGSYTLACWAKWVGGTPNGTLFGARTGVLDEVQLLMNAGKLRFYMEGDSNDMVQETSDDDQLTTDDWYHVVVTVTKNSGSNTGVLLYVNGSAIDITNSGQLTEANHNAYTSSANLFIGARNTDGTNDGGWGTDSIGRIDEPAIWNVALDADAVAAIYNSGVPFDLTSNNGDYDNSGDLVGYWRFNEGNGTTAIDEGGSNNATLNGGATYSNDTV